MYSIFLLHRSRSMWLVDSSFNIFLVDKLFSILTTNEILSASSTQSRRRSSARQCCTIVHYVNGIYVVQTNYKILKIELCCISHFNFECSLLWSLLFVRAIQFPSIRNRSGICMVPFSVDVNRNLLDFCVVSFDPLQEVDL